MRRGGLPEEVWRIRAGLPAVDIVEQPRPIAATELMNKDLPPVKWAVSRVLPEGVTILAGKPKMGKSWLALGLCVSVAAGGYALGKIRAERGGALYLGLEDQERRLQRRLKKILAGNAAPKGLEVTWAWPRLDQGGDDALRGYLEERPDVRLVVVDTLKKIRPRETGSRSVYDLDYEALEPLLPIAAEHGVAILVVHHLRKLEAGDPLDMISGSTGLTGGVDGALVLKRDRGKQDATLAVDGRDIEEPSELALRWDTEIASWSLMGDAEEFRMSEQRRAIVDLLRSIGSPMGPKEIAAALGRSYGAVRVMLPEMVSDGLITSPLRGKYTTTNNTNNTNNTNTANNANNAPETGNVSDVSAATNNLFAENSVGMPNPSNVSDVSAVSRERRLTMEEAEHVKEMVQQGWSAKLARATVLGEGWRDL
jgi:hypothetical protein